MMMLLRRVAFTSFAAAAAFTTRKSIATRHHRPPLTTPVVAVSLNKNPLDSLFPHRNPETTSDDTNAATTTVQTFVEAYSQGNVQQSTLLFSEDGVFDDFSYASPCKGRFEVERRFRLELAAISAYPFSSNKKAKALVIDDLVVSSSHDSNKVGIKFHSNEKKGGKRRGTAFFVLDAKTGLIDKVDWVVEPENKPGEDSLKVLSVVSKLLALLAAGSNNSNMDTPASDNDDYGGTSPPEKYFEAWNRRDMDAAASLFSHDVVYDDTVFPKPFSGLHNLKKHLLRCADVFPSSFTFEVDDVVANNNNDNNNNNDAVLVRWHVENGGKPLPFTRGCSFYTLDKSSGKIKTGIDIVEPSGPIKPGGVSLFLSSIKRKIEEEPARLVPITAWIAYMYIVFLSDGILPGANALALEERTWKEVLDLSLNFFLVSPLLHLPFSPVVHPMLEGVFNLLLSWAAMFAGFLSDDRRDKPNLLPMLPIVVGMQFLTSAFLLPYLATRSSEDRNDVSRQDLSLVAQICESRALGVAMGIVGSGSIVWAFLGRMADFGNLNERWSSFLDLLSIDRVGSSFIVDLAIFALFQAWLVDDDLKRRGMLGDDIKYSNLVFLAKYVPFFGMVAYLLLRSPLPTTRQSD